MEVTEDKPPIYAINMSKEHLALPVKFSDILDSSPQMSTSLSIITNYHYHLNILVYSPYMLLTYPEGNIFTHPICY